MNMRKISVLLLLLSCVGVQEMAGSTYKQRRDNRRALLISFSEQLQKMMALNPVERDASDFVRTTAENRQLAAQLQQLVQEMNEAEVGIPTPLTLSLVQKKIDELNELPGTASATARSYAAQNAALQNMQAQQIIAIQQLKKMVNEQGDKVRAVQHQLKQVQQENSKLVAVNNKLTKKVDKKNKEEQMVAQVKSFSAGDWGQARSKNKIGLLSGKSARFALSDRN